MAGTAHLGARGVRAVAVFGPPRIGRLEARGRTGLFGGGPVRVTPGPERCRPWAGRRLGRGGIGRDEWMSRAVARGPRGRVDTDDAFCGCAGALRCTRRSQGGRAGRRAAGHRPEVPGWWPRFVEDVGLRLGGADERSDVGAISHACGGSGACPCPVVSGPRSGAGHDARWCRRPSGADGCRQLQPLRRWTCSRRARLGPVEMGTSVHVLIPETPR
jgi:hypothetical protein